MRGAIRDSNLAVILASVVLVADEDGDGGAQGDTVEADAGEDLARVLLVPGGGDAGLAGATAVELELELVAGNLQARGTPSTTQPTPPPWDSPKVVTRNIRPKVLPMARTADEGDRI